MGSGLQVEALGDAVEQVEQLPALLLAKCLGDLPVEPFRLPFRLPEELLAGGGQVEVADAAVAGVWLPLEQAALLELVDDRPWDLVRDTVVDLGLPLVRIEQRRRGLEELFQ